MLYFFFLLICRLGIVYSLGIFYIVKGRGAPVFRGSKKPRTWIWAKINNSIKKKKNPCRDILKHLNLLMKVFYKKQ